MDAKGLLHAIDALPDPLHPSTQIANRAKLEIERLRNALSEVADRGTLSCDGGELDWLIEEAREALGRDPKTNRPN